MGAAFATTLAVPAGIALADEAALGIAVSVWAPEVSCLGRAPTALVCLAGGNMNRRYFDLKPPAEAGGGDLRPADGDESFSFAAQMVARGFVVVALDHLGLGDSTRPKDGYALTPQLLVEANVKATREVLERLREGRLSKELPALPGLRSVGVGHSMGAMLTVLQQAAARQHRALALLGFSTRGLPEYVPAPVRELPREQQRARLVEFARQMFREPYPVLRSSGNGAQIYGSANADPKGVAALKAATDCLLPVPAYMSMLPGNVAPEAAQIEVPLFLGLGERDMAGPPQDIPAAFTTSRDITLYVQPGAGHSHFLFPTRGALFDRIASWAQSLPETGTMSS